jgi:glyoxylase I family protein
MPSPIPFRLLGLDHVVLRVRDPARAERFYVDVLGCTLERRQDAIGLTQLRAGAALIDLVDVHGAIGREGGAAPGPDGRNMDHFCLQIGGFEAAALADHLRAHGVDPGEVRRRFGAEGEGPSIYIDDPDGNRIELKASPRSQATETAGSDAVTKASKSPAGMGRANK